MRAILGGKTTRCIVTRTKEGWKVEHFRKMLNSWNREVWVLTHEFNCDEFVEKPARE